MTVHISSSVFAAWMRGRLLSDSRAGVAATGYVAATSHVAFLFGCTARQPNRNGNQYFMPMAARTSSRVSSAIAFAALVTVMQDVADCVHILGQLGAALAVRGQNSFTDSVTYFFKRAGAGVADLLGDFLRVAAGHQDRRWSAARRPADG